MSDDTFVVRPSERGSESMTAEERDKTIDTLIACFETSVLTYRGGWVHCPLYPYEVKIILEALRATRAAEGKGASNVP